MSTRPEHDHHHRLQQHHTAAVGLQWGDEGKGKIVDLLAREHDVIVRYNGGANAGHSVVIDGQRYALHLLPSGILTDGKMCVIGNGVVVDPAQVLKEVETLRGRGIPVSPANLVISSRAHVVMPWHQRLDAALEHALSGRGGGAQGANGDQSIGTTRKGIGPAYSDKVTRSTALRMADLIDAERLSERIRTITRIKNAHLLSLDPTEPAIDAEALIRQYLTIGRALAPHVCDTTYLLHELIGRGQRILFEGANASLLDIDHGTFPYVTSSNCSALGVFPGTGIPGRYLTDVLGIMKAYSTRVGAGPFPTELVNDIGNRIRERGAEYGTTTGRPRRCGWLDLVAVRYSAMLSGCTRIAVMLLDVLAGLDELKICTAYRLPADIAARLGMPCGGEIRAGLPAAATAPDAQGMVTTERFLPDAWALARVEPVYETLPGFSEEITEATTMDHLPPAAMRYVQRISEVVGLPVDIVSVGPDRRQTLRQG